MKTLLKEVKKCKENFKINLCVAADICGISCSTLYRYNMRMEKGEDIIQKRGRKPLPPFEQGLLKLEIAGLKHGKKRTAGTKELYKKYDGIFSYRILNRATREIRKEYVSRKRQSMIMIQWHCPHMVWSMDDFEFRHQIKSHVDQVHDLSSKYKFEPLSRPQDITGDEIAGNLDKLFRQYGAPLILKCDNAGNFKSLAVKDVLNEYRVIMLNNPPYYPQYNGSMEYAQREVKQELIKMLCEFKNPDTFPFAVRQAVHNINHKPRPVLNGECSCFQWQMHADVRFSKTKRTEVYNIIKQFALDIAEGVQYSNQQDQQVVLIKSWRKAIETWLHQNGHITMRRNGKVLPV